MNASSSCSAWRFSLGSSCSSPVGWDAIPAVNTETDESSLCAGIASQPTHYALNQITTFDRVIAIQYPTSSENVSYNYDSGTNCGNGIGRLCQVTDAAGTSQFQYDAFGNVTQESRTESGVTYTTSYQYDAANRITSVTYPDGRIVNYTRDSLGRIQSVSTTVNGSTQTIVSNRTYRADGLLTGETFGNGVNDVRQ